MSITVSEEYLVHKVHSTYAWLQVLHGPNQGLRLSVPLYHDNYSTELQTAINQHLTENTVVNATLVRPDEPEIKWRLAELNPTDYATV